MIDNYRTGRLFARGATNFGWFILGIGVVALPISLSTVDRFGFGHEGEAILAMLTAVFTPICLIGTGIVTVAVAEAARATMDTADYSRQLLHYIRNG